tara:strand:- start:1921 stop:2103 length:183 start_codon:yes stop_codon:yes gene_type:complete
VKIPSAKALAAALQLVAEANKTLEELELPRKLLPELLRHLADRLDQVAEDGPVPVEVLEV